MDLICINCGNREYFETDVETVKEINPHGSSALVQNAVFDSWDHTEASLRANLDDTIRYILYNSADILSFNHETGYYYNPYMYCSRCGSARVTIRMVKWSPKQIKPLDEEILANRKEYKLLRKERNRVNLLPVLYEL